MPAPAAAAVAMLFCVGPRLIGDMLGVGRQLRMANGRRRIAKTQIDIDPVKARLVGLAGAADNDDMRPLLEQRPVRDLQG